MVTIATFHLEFDSEDACRILGKTALQDTTASMLTSTLLVGIV
jgi:hypothetical protein